MKFKSNEEIIEEIERLKKSYLEKKKALSLEKNEEKKSFLKFCIKEAISEMERRNIIQFQGK